MEIFSGIIFLILFYGGIAFIGWVFEKIGEWNRKRKEEIRDEVAHNVLEDTDITDELIADYSQKLESIGLSNQHGNSSFWLDVLSDGKKTHKPLVGGQCSDCNEGYLRVVKGKYGKFIGCSKYPSCKFTKDMKVAMREYQQRSHDEFIELFNLAYK